MDHSKNVPLSWLAALACAVALTACGGGGGGGNNDAPVKPLPPPDARNGDYMMYAADAHEYALSLDFDFNTYRLTGNGQDLTGKIRLTNTSGEYDVDPASTAASAPGAPHFSFFNDTVVGGFQLPGGTVPFIASRSFITTLADAAGTYNFLSSVRDTAAPADTNVFAGELLASGTLRTCNDSTVFRMSLCPPGSVATATVTVNGDQFTADTGSGAYPFRIVKVGNDRIFLRASISVGTTRRFTAGTLETPFTDGTFDGENNRGEATRTSIAGAAYSANWSSAGGNIVNSGTASSLGSGSGPSGIELITTGTGNFYAIRNTDLLVLMSARGSSTFPGYVEIGRR